MRKSLYLVLVLALLVVLLMAVQPVAAQSSATCTANGRTYTAGQYFFNAAGQEYICNADGSLSYIGFTLGSPPMYPYPFVYPVENMPQELTHVTGEYNVGSVECAYNGNRYNIGQSFWDQAGRQVICNSDGTIAYMGIVSSTTNAVAAGVTTCTAGGCYTSYPMANPNMLAATSGAYVYGYPYTAAAINAYPYNYANPYANPYTNVYPYSYTNSYVR